MAELPYLSTTATDHLAQTAHLSLEALGAFEVLRLHYWLRQGPLPGDEQQLARLARAMPAQWKKIRAEVLGMFVLTEAGYTHAGLEKDLAKAKDRSAKAKQSADDRWTKGKAKAMRSHTEGSAQFKRKLCSPSPSSSPLRERRLRPLNPHRNSQAQKSDKRPFLVCAICGYKRTSVMMYCENPDHPDGQVDNQFVTLAEYESRRKGAPV